MFRFRRRVGVHPGDVMFALVPALAIALSAAAEDRSIDGTGNNPLAINDTWGAAGTNVIRSDYFAFYPDGFGDAIDDGGRPNARDVSNVFHAQGAGALNARGLSDWVVQWGQFLTHDMDLTTSDAAYDVMSSGATGDYSIAITDPVDPLGPNPIPFHRSTYDPSTGDDTVVGPGPFGPLLNARQQINSVTSFIDASNVYGSDATRAAALRTLSGGQLATSAGGLLPGLNTAGLDNDDPFGLGASLFLAGDVRTNEQVGLTAAHALFVREHNRLAAALASHNPSLTDEQIYQVARKIVGAEMQIITYEQFLPALMGAAAPDPDAYGYADDVNPSISSAFATAAFRFGHSMQSPDLLMVDNAGQQVDALSLAQAFFDPTILGNNPQKTDLLLKGMATRAAQENDLGLVDEIRNFLFGPPGAGGLDLAALDIQRGRDHGVPEYNSLRHFYGIGRVTSFSQITSDTALQAELLAQYGGVDNIDAFVGLLAEDHVSGASMGELALAMLGDQFTRLRDGDRFFYTGDPDLLSPDVLAVIDLDNITLAGIIMANTSITNLQDDVFFDASPPLLLLGDTDNDAAVTADDLLAVQQNFGNIGPSGDGTDLGDANDDGLVTADDLLAVQQNFGNVLGPAAGGAAVPEPATLALAGLSMLVTTRRRR